MQPPRLPTPYATRTILFVCVGLQLLALLLGPAFSHGLVLSYGLVPARISGLIVGLEGPVPTYVTLFTHMFLHGGVLHLAMNMLFLGWIGRQVEWLVGTPRFVLLYVLGGLAGAFLQIFMSPASPIPMVGASGAIAAVFAAYALLFAQTGEAPAKFLGIRLSGETVRALRYAALWIGLQLLTSVAFNVPGSAMGVAIWSHIGGFIAGLIFALPLVRRQRG